MGLIPSTVVAATVGRSGIDGLLVASQVVLSIVLPFVIFPLVYLTSNPAVMSVTVPTTGYPATTENRGEPITPSQAVKEVNYRNGKVMMCLGYLIFGLVVVANAYVLVTLVVPGT